MGHQTAASSLSAIINTFFFPGQTARGWNGTKEPQRNSGSSFSAPYSTGEEKENNPSPGSLLITSVSPNIVVPNIVVPNIVVPNIVVPNTVVPNTVTPGIVFQNSDDKNRINQVVTIRGEYFTEGAAVTLEKENASPVEGKEVSVVSSKEITCIFDIGHTPAGEWDLVVTNPGNQRSFSKKAFIISDSPKLISTTLISGWDNSTMNRVKISGGPFLRGAVVKLTKKGETDIYSDTMINNGEYISCSFDLTDKKAGPRHLEVINPGGQRSVKKNAFVIYHEKIDPLNDPFGIPVSPGRLAGQTRGALKIPRPTWIGTPKYYKER